MTIGISFDIAPTHSALIIWHNEEMIEFDSTKKPGCEIIEMNLWLIKQLDFYCILNKVSWVAVEKSIYINNAKNTIDLGKLLGALEVACIKSGIQFFEGTTAEIDSACGIPHKDRKTYTRSLAETYFAPGTKLNEDTCDAIAIGIWGWGKWKEYQFSKED